MSIDDGTDHDWVAVWIGDVRHALTPRLVGRRKQHCVPSPFEIVYRFVDVVDIEAQLKTTGAGLHRTSMQRLARTRQGDAS